MLSRTYLPLALIVTMACSQSGTAQTSSKSASALVVFISGAGSDASADQIAHKAPRGGGNSGMYQLMADLEKAGYKTKFFNWNGTAAGQFTQENAPGADAIVASIRDTYAKTKFEHLILVGHSWGGHTMLEVATALAVEPTMNIDLAIGLDPSSLMRGERMKQLPPNVGKLINFHTHNAFTWGEWKDDPHVENIDLGDPANGYMVNGNPSYGAVLDVSAHNAAEWDEHIHAEITKRITTTITDLR